MKIANIVGARPNFMKIAPIMKEMRKHSEIEATLIHTGQHYDASMAGQFFKDLQIPPPDVSLEVGSGSHAYQTGEVMKRLESVFEYERPDVVLVVGDVNSTLAAAMTAAKLHIAVAHVKAGLRSFDRSPERIAAEVSRVLGAPLPRPVPPPLWDGHASQRIVATLLEHAAGRGRASRST